MAEKTEIAARKCLTPEFRVSFPQVFQPKAFEGQEPKYSVVMLFDKKTDISALKKAALNAAIEKFGQKDKWPKNMRLPFRNGDDKADMAGYAGTIVVSASAKQKPGVVNQKLEPVNEGDGVFYAGCYARASIIAFGYDKAGNKGVGFSLQNLQKLRDGEQFSGRRAAHDEFDKVEDTSDLPGNYPASSGDDLGL